MAGQPGRSGGQRPGAGRKPTRILFGEAVEKAETRLAKRLMITIGNLEELADGKAVVTEEEWQPAGSILVDKPLTYPNGQPLVASGGKAAMQKVSAYPDKLADELVLVKRKIVHLPPSDKVNMYIMDRIAGKPVTPTDEPDVLSPDELAQAVGEIEGAIAQVTDAQTRSKLTEKLRELAQRFSGEA
jgi:hypothetical protein